MDLIEAFKINATNFQCVHEQSSNVSAVCSSVESCLQLGEEEEHC